MHGLERIETVHVMIAVDQDGTEGVPAMLLPDGTHLPLVACNELRVQEITEMAKVLAAVTGAEIRHVRFNCREDLEIIK